MYYNGFLFKNQPKADKKHKKYMLLIEKTQNRIYIPYKPV
jgi:hypothetical protein